MNTVAHLSRRLLKLFPVSLIKNDFQTNVGLQDAIIDYIMAHNTHPQIREYALSNIGYTKQHIYIFQLERNFNRGAFDTTDFPVEIIRETNIDGDCCMFAHPIVEFRAAVSDPFEEVVIRFQQPLKITVNGRSLIIQATILEKNLNSYFHNRRVFEAKKVISEEAMIESIKARFDIDYDVTICDLNRGVKYLWQHDIVDLKFARFRKSRSMSTEAMDENRTLKVEYPDLYAQMITSPLEKMVIRYLREDNEFCEHFTVDPSQGTLSMAIFPENSNQIENVIDAILSNN